VLGPGNIELVARELDRGIAALLVERLDKVYADGSDTRRDTSAESMTANEVLEVLGWLDMVGIEVWVDGGWGVDALLGEETRPHSDLDLALPLRLPGTRFPWVTRT